MIPLHDVDKPHTYAYVAGCRNVAWLVGKVEEINADEKLILISRSGASIPIEVDEGDRIPDDLVVSQSVKLICHVYSGTRGGDEESVKAGRHPRLVAKYIGRPTLLDMRPATDFAKLDINDANAFDTFDLPEVLTPASNRLELAGFVDGAPVLVRDRENEKDRLVFMVRQAPGPQYIIPVEIAGKHAANYRKTLRIGAAIFLNGIVLPGRRESGEPVAIVRSDHVTKALPVKDFSFEALPDWVGEIRKRYNAQVLQERERQAAIQAGRQAEALALSLRQ